MNRIFIYASRLVPRSIEETSRLELEPNSDVADKNKQLLDLIYSRDPESGLPVGDLAIFMNENANPEVRAFIESSLLSPAIDSKGLSLPQDVINKMQSQLGDDDISFFTRFHGESSSDYAERLSQYFESQKNIASERKRIAELKRLMDQSRNN